MAKVRGECLYCSCKLPLYLRLRNADFCCEAHRVAYYDEQQRLALERLIETERILSSARARRLPLRGPRPFLPGEQASLPEQGGGLVATRTAGPLSYSPRALRNATRPPELPADPASPRIPVVVPVGPALDRSSGLVALDTNAPQSGTFPSTAEAGSIRAELAALAAGAHGYPDLVHPEELVPSSIAEAVPFAVRTVYPRMTAAPFVAGAVAPAKFEMAAVAPDRAPIGVAVAAGFSAGVAMARRPPSEIVARTGCSIAGSVQTAAQPRIASPAVCGPEGPFIATVLPAGPRTGRDAGLERASLIPGPRVSTAAGAPAGPAPRLVPEPERAGPGLALPAVAPVAGSSNIPTGFPAAVTRTPAAAGARETAVGKWRHPVPAPLMPPPDFAAPGQPEPPVCLHTIALPRHFATEDWGLRVYGPVPGARTLKAVIPVWNAELVTGAPLPCSGAPATGFAGEQNDVPPHAPLSSPLHRPLVALRAKPVPLSSEPIPTTPRPARSVEALRRARHSSSASPPMCVRIARIAGVGKPTNDATSLPAPPFILGPLAVMVPKCFPDAGLQPRLSEVLRPEAPVPPQPARFQRPPDLPPPVLNPVLPLPVSPPTAHIPAPRFRSSLRHRVGMVRDWIVTPRGWALAAALILAAGFHPALSHFGGFGGLRQSLAGSGSAFQAAVANRAGVRLAEDFHSRFDRWEGRRDPVLTWKVDEAGFVVPGELAVFRPSARMSDYRLEFLGGIDRKALSWAFRVRDLSNYYVARIVITRPGPLPALALERYAVLHGKETPHRTNPISLTIRGESMMKVSMHAKGSDFDVRIDGRIVDSWTDDRIGTGGIGFFTGRGESSKIRWMKLEYQYDILGRVCSWFAASPVIPDGIR